MKTRSWKRVNEINTVYSDLRFTGDLLKYGINKLLFFFRGESRHRKDERKRGVEAGTKTKKTNNDWTAKEDSRMETNPVREKE